MEFSDFIIVSSSEQCRLRFSSHKAIFYVVISFVKGAVFLDECTVPSFAGSVRAKDLYNVYVIWCEDNGEYKMTNTKFGLEMAKKYERTKTRTGWIYKGLDVSDDYKPYEVRVKL